MDYFAFKEKLESELSKLKLPAGCTQQEAVWEVLSAPISWTIELFFVFDDNNHIRIWEQHDRFAHLQICRRIAWSYHYGPVTDRDDEGNVIQGEANDPLEIRIDTCGGPAHLHYLAQEPHYAQASVGKLDLDTVDAIGFVKAVLKRRKTGKGFPQVLGFRLPQP